MKDARSLDLVQISRIEDLDPIVCKIYQSTTDCIIAAELSDSLDLDGVCLLPTKSIRYFDNTFDKADFYRAALGAWSGVLQNIDFVNELACDMKVDLKFLANKKSTVAIHMEIDDPNICYIGSIREMTDSVVLLDRISSRGNRIDEPLPIDIDSITKVEVMTRYLIAVGFAANQILGGRSQA